MPHKLQINQQTHSKKCFKTQSSLKMDHIFNFLYMLTFKYPSIILITALRRRRSDRGCGHRVWSTCAEQTVWGCASPTDGTHTHKHTHSNATKTHLSMTRTSAHTQQKVRHMFLSLPLENKGRTIKNKVKPKELKHSNALVCACVCVCVLPQLQSSQLHHTLSRSKPSFCPAVQQHDLTQIKYIKNL